MEHLARISEYVIQPRTSFSKLISLEIRNCSAIKYLFSNSVAKCLVQLQDLTIHDCPEMEAIIMNEGTSDGDIINFSKLISLELLYLLRLKSFYREKKEMDSSSTSILDNSVIPSVQSQPLFHEMVAFPCFEKLHIIGLEDTIEIWGKYYSNDIVSSSFCKLKRLYVSNLSKLEAVFPLAMLHRLRNLEHLEIWYCNSLRNVFLPSIVIYLMHLRTMIVSKCEMMREIIGGAGEQEDITDDDGIIVFPESKFLELGYLPNLTSFWCHQNGKADTYKVEFPNLVRFCLYYAEIDLEEIKLGKDDSTCQLMTLRIRCNKEIRLPYEWALGLYNLEELALGHWWHHELKSVCFQRLKVLRVYYSGYSTLFTFSGFRNLQLLQQLDISNSAFLENIVEDVRDDEVSGMDEKAITLFQLRYVILTDLPNLKSFIYNANYELHMPALENVKVDKCGLSTLFTFSAFRSLQLLQVLVISDCALLEEIVEHVKGDEASGIDKKTITLYQLRSVILIDLPKLKSFIHSANFECHMPALTKVKVDKCELSTLFTFSVVRTLQQLEELEISNCGLLEEIVEDVSGDEASVMNTKIITFSRLRSVTLKNLPNLKSFTYDAQIMSSICRL